MPNWVLAWEILNVQADTGPLHDPRHTVLRTGMSRLRISTKDVRVRVLGHVDRSVDGGYDQHDYLDEKREALELWGARVAKIFIYRERENLHPGNPAVEQQHPEARRRVQD
jgi:hypothetical protein